VKPLTLNEAEFIAHTLVKELMDFEDEPIPPFNTRYPGILESCLLEPFQGFGGKDLHPTFERKAAVMFYLVIKNHPFENGNKRMAVVLNQILCYKNKRWLDIPPLDLYNIATDVAKSKPKEKDDILNALDKTFNKYIKSLAFIDRLTSNR
jgi:death on curing protein